MRLLGLPVTFDGRTTNGKRDISRRRIAARLPAINDLLRPVDIGRETKIGVRFILKAPPICDRSGLHWIRPAILPPTRRVTDRAHSLN